MANKKQDYYFTVVVDTKNAKNVPDYHEYFKGFGATPEEALTNSMDEQDLEFGQTQKVFYFTIEHNSKTGFLNVTRTGLKIERV